MIRPLDEHDYASAAWVWLEASLKAHSFIASEYWCSRVSDVCELYLPCSDIVLGFFDETQGTLVEFVALTDEMLNALFVAPLWQKKGIGS